MDRVQPENLRDHSLSWAPPQTPPPFLSRAFHVDFFPKVLRYRYRQYRNRDRNRREHVYFEIPLALTACVIVAVIGFPSAVKGSVLGITLLSLGSLGLAAIVSWAVISEYGCRITMKYTYTYESFVPSIFVFFVMLGLTAGMLVGGVVYDSQRLAAASALAGLVAGYVVGIFAGRWVHALGFMDIWFIYLANVASIFMVIENFILLLLVFKLFK